MPDLPPLPETAANAAFRRWYTPRWGRENALICGRSTRAEYPVHTQTLSVKLAWAGSERYMLPHRELVVDDDSYLILNEGRSYASVLRSTRPVHSFSVFFRPGLPAEVQAARRQTLEAALAQPDAAPRGTGFSEHLRRHDARVTPRLRGMHRAALAGERSEDWLEQQMLLLLGDMLDAEAEAEREAARLPVARTSTQRELARRLRRAMDVIESRFAEPIGLTELAEAACLSRYHFVRHFREFYGTTPHAALTAKRARVAQRLLDAGVADVEAVAQRCGLGSRWSLQRALRRHRHAAPATA